MAKKQKKEKSIRSGGEMVRLEIEVAERNQDYEIKHTSYYKLFSDAKRVIPKMKTKYALNNKDYRIFIVVSRG
jgi:hypothetical protein